MNVRLWSNLQRKASRSSAPPLVGPGQPTDAAPKNDGRTVRPLDYKEIERMPAEDAKWHLNNNPENWKKAFDEESRRQQSKKHVVLNRTQMQWQGHATEIEDAQAKEAAQTFAEKFSQFERSLPNAQKMARYMQENDLPGTELSSYVAAFRALSEKGELALAKPESSAEFYANHLELHPTGVPPLVQVREAKAASTAAHFEAAQSASVQAGSTTVTDFPQKQHGVPPLGNIERASLRALVRNMTSYELAAKCAADPSFKKALDSLQ